MEATRNRSVTDSFGKTSRPTAEAQEAAHFSVVLALRYHTGWYLIMITEALADSNELLKGGEAVQLSLNEEDM